MPTYTIENNTSGHVLGSYEAENARAALDVMARDAGYKDHADQQKQTGDHDDDLNVYEMYEERKPIIPTYTTKPLQFATPEVDRAWADSRDTHPAVAVAIHAIADSTRSPEAIWEAPTRAEWETVTSAVENYVANDVFEAEPDGRYPWGLEAISLEA